MCENSWRHIVLLSLKYNDDQNVVTSFFTMDRPIRISHEFEDGIENSNPRITIVIPNNDPRECLFYLILTQILDSFLAHPIT